VPWPETAVRRALHWAVLDSVVSGAAGGCLTIPWQSHLDLIRLYTRGLQGNLLVVRILTAHFRFYAQRIQLPLKVRGLPRPSKVYGLRYTGGVSRANAYADMALFVFSCSTVPESFTSDRVYVHGMHQG
jgi:hypothetical protein